MFGIEEKVEMIYLFLQCAKYNEFCFTGSTVVMISTVVLSRNS